MVETLASGVVVALDHGLHWGEFDGFEDREETLKAVLDGEPDGILASVPFFEQYADVFESYPSVYQIGTVDVIHDSTIPGHQGDAEIHRQAFSLDRAAEAGVDAVKACLIYGRSNASVLGDNLEFVSKLTGEGRNYDLSVMVEPTLWGPQIPDDLDAELIANAARIGSELGPDMLKLYYPNDPDAFGAVVSNAPYPVFVAGGPKADTTSAVLEMTSEIVGTGAAGITYGRNVWQHDDPTALVAALSDIVNDGALPAETEQYFN
ncbi:class I fructose-bisphosphate aldolase [Halohasta litorea]|uniref:fructose-bisphosphate aldolase n=1 Tax=Halohasta litorea TaxID=869891 RepID=A0ABD6D750_9EURY|nr:fructose-1,6-bisphosphate aldolase [Halohasta litorea]MEA1931165.1 fructose-1,6-bisphosphate aldolase [Euryarchaeota archaeon]